MAFAFGRFSVVVFFRRKLLLPHFFFVKSIFFIFSKSKTKSFNFCFRFQAATINSDTSSVTMYGNCCCGIFQFGHSRSTCNGSRGFSSSDVVSFPTHFLRARTLRTRGGPAQCRPVAIVDNRVPWRAGEHWKIPQESSFGRKEVDTSRTTCYVGVDTYIKPSPTHGAQCLAEKVILPNQGHGTAGCLLLSSGGGTFA